MDAILVVLVVWLFNEYTEEYSLDNCYSDDYPDQIPRNVEEISNDALHKKYGSKGMSENISLFIHKGRIFVYYQSLDGVKIWQSIQIPHGWSVREDFQLVCYSWYNLDDDDFPQNLRILVSFDRGFLNLDFVSKLAPHDHEVDRDYNLVRLVHTSAHEYFCLFNRFPGEQRTIRQRVSEESMRFESCSKWNDHFFIRIEEYFFGGEFAKECCIVVLPLSMDVKQVELCNIQTVNQWVFFDLWGNRVPLNISCHFTVETNSQEKIFVLLRLIPPSDLPYLDDDDDIVGPRVYRHDVNHFDLSNQNGKLSGLILPWDCLEGIDCVTGKKPGKKLREIFPLTE